MFGSLQKDRVTVLRNTGEKYECQAASVQGDRIYMRGFKQLIEAGDLIERHMSNGGTETYEVVDPGWHEGLAGAIPAGYDMRVRKAGARPANDLAPTQAVAYHIYGHNARVNNNSVDHSSNVVTGGQEDVTALLAQLVDEIKALELPKEQHEEALDFVDAAKSQFEHGGTPKRSVMSAILAGLPAAGNIASIIGAITALCN